MNRFDFDAAPGFVVDSHPSADLQRPEKSLVTMSGDGGGYTPDVQDIDEKANDATKCTATIVTTVPTNDSSTYNPSITCPTPINLLSRKNSLVIDDYFEGPRDITKHSKWPLFLQMHGSILPDLVVPLLLVALWSTLITCLSQFLPVNLGVDPTLLTVTGFTVSLALSFRSSTAYERYSDGRRCWMDLQEQCQVLARTFWLHCKESEDPQIRKKQVLEKLTALNLLSAFAVALKHKLRFEPYTYYDDLTDLVEHLETFAKSATNEDIYKPRARGFFRTMGEHLGISFALSNPRKALKKATCPTGNLPLEILDYLSCYLDDVINEGRLPIGMTQTLAYNGLSQLNGILAGTERIVNTPVPIAYAICISQITWVYVFLLPFQLLSSLGWVTIPASIFAAHIILGLLFIGREIEDPFGHDVNDLPLDLYCQQIVQDIEIIAARPKPRMADYVESDRNKVLFPHSNANYHIWASRSEHALRKALRKRPYAYYDQANAGGDATPREKGDNNV